MRSKTSAVHAWNRSQEPEASRLLPVSRVSLPQQNQIPTLTQVRIADLDVGRRVWVGENPSAERDYEFGQDVTQSKWRLMVLQAPKVAGSWADVRMIRPASWLAERNVHVGGAVNIEAPECGIEGDATVVRLGDCPPVQPGPGRVITATFRHQAASVVDVEIEGETEPIGSTPNHPFWSDDRQAFVRADSLRPGERVLTLRGLAQVIGISERGPPEPVYNLEVQVEHVYRVGESGSLVHNSIICPGFSGLIVVPRRDMSMQLFNAIDGVPTPVY